MATYVLIHGAFRGGWAWRRVRRLLEAQGHQVHTPSLIGCGELAGLIDRATSLDVWRDQITGLLDAEDLDEVILVGHSQGGLVTRAVAALSDRVRVVVHIDAAVPKSGSRAIDLMPLPEQLPAREAVVAARPAEPGGEYDEPTRVWLNERLTDSPVGPALDAVPRVRMGVKEHFYFCARTPADYPSVATRARLDKAGVGYQLLQAGHDAPLSAPRLVADELLHIATL